MKRALAVLALTLAAALPVRAQATEPAHPSVTLPAELDRVLRDYEREWRASNAAGLALLFAADGFVLRGGHPPVRGRAGIEEAYRGSGGPLHLRAFAFALEGSVGYIIGGYAGAAGQGDDGKFILTLRREPDGRWLITADMDNSNRARRPGGG